MIARRRAILRVRRHADRMDLPHPDSRISRTPRRYRTCDLRCIVVPAPPRRRRLGGAGGTLSESLSVRGGQCSALDAPCDRTRLARPGRAQYFPLRVGDEKCRGRAFADPRCRVGGRGAAALCLHSPSCLREQNGAGKTRAPGTDSGKRSRSCCPNRRRKRPACSILKPGGCSPRRRSCRKNWRRAKSISAMTRGNGFAPTARTQWSTCPAHERGYGLRFFDGMGGLILFEQRSAEVRRIHAAFRLQDDRPAGCTGPGFRHEESILPNAAGRQRRSGLHNTGRSSGRPANRRSRQRWSEDSLQARARCRALRKVTHRRKARKAFMAGIWGWVERKAGRLRPGRRVPFCPRRSAKSRPAGRGRR